MLATKSRNPAHKRRKRSFPQKDISSRLVDVELATVGALRSLQMDLENDPGVPLESALRDAQRALKK